MEIDSQTANMVLVPTIRRFALIFILTALAGASGCDRDDDSIRFYQAPKEEAVAAAVAAPSAPIEWTAPPGWKSMPGGQMRFASYAVDDANPPHELTIIPLPTGDLLSNVNRWEKQLGLAPSSADKLPQVVKHTSANGLEIDSVDLTGSEAGKPARMLASIVPAGGEFWYFKLVGPVDLVTKQKANFDALMASLKPSEDAATPQPQAPISQAQSTDAPPKPQAPPTIAAGAQSSSGPQQLASELVSYKAPLGWQKLPGKSEFRVVAFQAGNDPACQVVVTQFGKNGAGSFLDNVNRWRGQLELPPESADQAMHLDDKMADVNVGSAGTGFMLELDNPKLQPPKGMLVVIAANHGDMWFIKMTGTVDQVEQQKSNFLAFMKSLDFSSRGDAVEPKP